MLKKLVVGIAAACVLSTAVYAKHANKEFTYRVTITNLTNLAFVSKAVVATHKRGIKLFELGQPNGILGLEVLAETGLPQTFINEMEANESDIFKSTELLTSQTMLPGGTASAPNLGLRAGESFSIDITADYEHPNVSVFAMVAPSNDAFISANSIKVPRHGKTVTIFSPVYDSGDESNTEFCYNEDNDAGGNPLPNGGLDEPAPEIPYTYRDGGPTNFEIEPAAFNENDPDYIPVPLGGRHNVCRLTDHTVHTADLAPLNTFDFKGANPTEGKRIPPPGIARRGTPNGEGKVLIHRGFQGVGQINPAMFDWRNPGAKITIKRIR